MDLVGHVADRMALQQLILDLGISGHGEECRQPVVMRDDLVRHGARLDLAGPADHARHPIGALPVGVLFVAERRHRPVGPGIHMRAVVGAVHDKGVVGDAGIVERLQHLADVLVVIDHRVVVFALPAARLAPALRLHMRAEMHVGEVHPEKERLAGLGLPLDVLHGAAGDVVVDRFHTLLGQRAGVADGLLADPAEARVDRRIVGVGGLAVHDAARTEPLAKVRKIPWVRVIRQFRLFLGVQVIQIAVELVEAVHCRQIFVAVAEMVLAELRGRIAQRLEQFGDRRVFLGQADRGGRQSDFGQPGAQAVLTGDERRPSGRAALLAVVVGETHALLGDAVDIGRPVAHQPVAVAAQIGNADIVAPDHDDVRLGCCSGSSHLDLLSLVGWFRKC